MDWSTMMHVEVPDLADVRSALGALDLRLSDQDIDKVAENMSLLSRHWRALAPALKECSSDPTL